AKLGTAEEGLTTLAANRGTEPLRLPALLRGELDWIVMKALEKDRNRRYETANGFAADVQRYLADEPVAAGPPSAAYRLRKFIKRRRPQVLAAGVVRLALLVGLGGTAWQAVRAEGQRAEAERNEHAANVAAGGEREARIVAQQKERLAQEAAEKEKEAAEKEK